MGLRATRQIISTQLYFLLQNPFSALFYSNLGPWKMTTMDCITSIFLFFGFHLCLALVEDWGVGKIQFWVFIVCMPLCQPVWVWWLVLAFPWCCSLIYPLESRCVHSSLFLPVPPLLICSLNSTNTFVNTPIIKLSSFMYTFWMYSVFSAKPMCVILSKWINFVFITTRIIQYEYRIVMLAFGLACLLAAGLLY